ncbi:uncharacterized protein K460DRAFT_128652 [Cucurbitaria berberidis CBS 394.84]|uniref:Uncharacterized protein n=1 Tax=Cucurbitaria berberidis CBS 394.84 TaxID=1168544 RepID=A0A9P4L9S4_9PLEO|nr:uncharacterized protein K460DRAFT_128652 [Cucurbitaria berberidis CBS 394.84]KAF1846698.1 hypothetical protein K460DRAFT_128652 [Cucurbitaria berberidis CBS 394.84]
MLSDHDEIAETSTRSQLVVVREVTAPTCFTGEVLRHVAFITYAITILTWFFEDGLFGMCLQYERAKLTRSIVKQMRKGPSRWHAERSAGLGALVPSMDDGNGPANGSPDVETWSTWPHDQTKIAARHVRGALTWPCQCA